MTSLLIFSLDLEAWILRNKHKAGPFILVVHAIRLRSGFCQALLGTLRLRADGLLMLGPPCGSFVWVNQATSKRSKDRPYGDESKEYVNIASLSFGVNYSLESESRHVFLLIFKLYMCWIH